MHLTLNIFLLLVVSMCGHCHRGSHNADQLNSLSSQDRRGGKPSDVNQQGRRIPRQADEDDRPVWGAPVAVIPDKMTQPRNSHPLGFSLLGHPKFNTSKGVIDLSIEQTGEPVNSRLLEHFKDFVKTPSILKCLEYCTFPNTYPLAQGGTEALPHEFPHMVALGFESGNFQGEPLIAWNSCGGSLISRDYVLTAAHCLDSDKGLPSLVRIGEHDLSKLDDAVPPQDFSILRTILHPDYDRRKGLYNDIALLQLTREINFTRVYFHDTGDYPKVIWPACLHQGLNIQRYEDEEKTVKALPDTVLGTGWGNLGFTDSPSDVLQKVELDIIDNATCSRLLGKDDVIPRGVDEKTQVCAGVLAGGRDTCTGDSGGPIQINNTMFTWRRYCSHEIVGITSFGRLCAEPNTPSVYTKVSYYVPWIESVVWPQKVENDG